MISPPRIRKSPSKALQRNRRAFTQNRRHKSYSSFIPKPENEPRKVECIIQELEKEVSWLKI